MLPFQKKLTNSFYALLSLPSTAMGFALSIQIAALSWILSTQYHLEIEQVGMVWAAGPLAGIFGQIIVGLISDNVWFWGGRRRPFILIGGTTAALMLLALPNIHNINNFLGIGNLMIVAVMVALTLDLAINISFNPTRSIIADVTPDGIPRTKGYTWMQTISGTFGVLAYLIGYIFDNFVLIYFGAGLVLLFSIVPMFFIEESKSLHSISETEKPPREKTSFKETLMTLEPLWGYIPFALFYLVIRMLNIQLPPETNNYIILAFVIVQLFFTIKILLVKEDNMNPEESGKTGYKKVLAAHSYSWIGVQTMFVYIFAFIKEMNYGNDAVLNQSQNDEIGKIIQMSFLILNAVGALVPVFVLEPVLERIGRVKTHYISLFIMAAGYLGIVLFADSAWVLYIFMVICGIGWGAIVSLPFAIMSEKITKSRMGLFMGLFNLAVVLPQLIVSVALGIFIQQSQNKVIIFIISTISLALSAVLWLMIKEEANVTLKENKPVTAGH